MFETAFWKKRGVGGSWWQNTTITHVCCDWTSENTLLIKKLRSIDLLCLVKVCDAVKHAKSYLWWNLSIYGRNFDLKLMHLFLPALTCMAFLKITAPEINSRKAHTKPSSYFGVGGGIQINIRKLSFLKLNLSVPMYSWGQCSKQLSPGGHPCAPGAGQIPSVGAAPAGAATGTQDTEMPPTRSILVPGSHRCWSGFITPSSFTRVLWRTKTMEARPEDKASQELFSQLMAAVLMKPSSYLTNAI